MNVYFHNTAKDELLKFAIIIAKHNGKWVFCKHKDRNTFELPGGHREPNETILQAAKRELYEETGALIFDIKPLFAYSVIGKSKVVPTGEETFGMLYFADVKEFEPELHSEIESVHFLMNCPQSGRIR